MAVDDIVASEYTVCPVKVLKNKIKKYIKINISRHTVDVSVAPLFLFPSVPGLAGAAEWGGPDSHRTNGNRKNPGLPAAGVHTHGRTASVRTQTVSLSFINYFTTPFSLIL